MGRNKSSPKKSCLFLWNIETGEILGRTCQSWAKIIGFYLIFYIALAIFIACLWSAFYVRYIDKFKPRWLLEESCIGTSPGMGFRPMYSEEDMDSTQIKYVASNDEQIQPWINELDLFLKPYQDPTAVGDSEYKMKCDYDKPPLKGKTCVVEVERLDPCNKVNGYNYADSQPCVFLKLNKIYGWKPVFYNDSNNLPKKMPEILKSHISNLSKSENKEDKLKLNTVWVSCEGESAADKDNIGPIDYMPMPGFPGYFYPYLNDDSYLSPLVAIMFKKVTRGVLINIECKAWAQNIFHDRKERLGLAHFELQVD